MSYEKQFDLQILRKRSLDTGLLETSSDPPCKINKLAYNKLDILNNHSLIDIENHYSWTPCINLLENEDKITRKLCRKRSQGVLCENPTFDSTETTIEFINSVQKRLCYESQKPFKFNKTDVEIEPDFVQQNTAVENDYHLEDVPQSFIFDAYLKDINSNTSVYVQRNEDICNLKEINDRISRVRSFSDDKLLVKSVNNKSNNKIGPSINFKYRKYNYFTQTVAEPQDIILDKSHHCHSQDVEFHSEEYEFDSDEEKCFSDPMFEAETNEVLLINNETSNKSIVDELPDKELTSDQLTDLIYGKSMSVNNTKIRNSDELVLSEFFSAKDDNTALKPKKSHHILPNLEEYTFDFDEEKCFTDATIKQPKVVDENASFQFDKKVELTTITSKNMDDDIISNKFRIDSNLNSMKMHNNDGLILSGLISGIENNSLQSVNPKKDELNSQHFNNKYDVVENNVNILSPSIIQEFSNDVLQEAENNFKNTANNVFQNDKDINFAKIEKIKDFNEVDFEEKVDIFLDLKHLTKLKNKNSNKMGSCKKVYEKKLIDASQQSKNLIFLLEKSNDEVEDNIFLQFIKPTEQLKDLKIPNKTVNKVGNDIFSKFIESTQQLKDKNILNIEDHNKRIEKVEDDAFPEFIESTQHPKDTNIIKLKNRTKTIENVEDNIFLQLIGSTEQLKHTNLTNIEDHNESIGKTEADIFLEFIESTKHSKDTNLTKLGDLNKGIENIEDNIFLQFLESTQQLKQTNIANIEDRNESIGKTEVDIFSEFIEYTKNSKDTNLTKLGDLNKPIKNVEDNIFSEFIESTKVSKDINIAHLKKSINAMENVEGNIFLQFVESTEQLKHSNITNNKDGNKTIEKVQDNIFSEFFESTKDSKDTNITNLKNSNKAMENVEGNIFLQFVESTDQLKHSNITNIKDGSKTIEKVQDDIFSEFIESTQNSKDTNITNLENSNKAIENVEGNIFLQFLESTEQLKHNNIANTKDGNKTIEKVQDDVFSEFFESTKDSKDTNITNLENSNKAIENVEGNILLQLVESTEQLKDNNITYINDGNKTIGKDNIFSEFFESTKDSKDTNITNLENSKKAMENVDGNIFLQFIESTQQFKHNNITNIKDGNKIIKKVQDDIFSEFIESTKDSKDTNIINLKNSNKAMENVEGNIFLQFVESTQHLKHNNITNTKDGNKTIQDDIFSEFIDSSKQPKDSSIANLEDGNKAIENVEDDIFFQFLKSTEQVNNINIADKNDCETAFEKIDGDIFSEFFPLAKKLNHKNNEATSEKDDCLQIIRIKIDDHTLKGYSTTIEIPVEPKMFSERSEEQVGQYNDNSGPIIDSVNRSIIMTGNSNLANSEGFLQNMDNSETFFEFLNQHKSLRSSENLLSSQSGQQTENDPNREIIAKNNCFELIEMLSQSCFSKIEPRKTPESITGHVDKTDNSESSLKLLDLNCPAQLFDKQINVYEDVSEPKLNQFPNISHLVSLNNIQKRNEPVGILETNKNILSSEIFQVDKENDSCIKVRNFSKCKKIKKSKKVSKKTIKNQKYIIKTRKIEEPLNVNRNKLHKINSDYFDGPKSSETNCANRYNIELNKEMPILPTQCNQQYDIINLNRIDALTKSDNTIITKGLSENDTSSMVDHIKINSEVSEKRVKDQKNNKFDNLWSRRSSRNLRNNNDKISPDHLQVNTILYAEKLQKSDESALQLDEIYRNTFCGRKIGQPETILRKNMQQPEHSKTSANNSQINKVDNPEQLYEAFVQPTQFLKTICENMDTVSSPITYTFNENTVNLTQAFTEIEDFVRNTNTENENIQKSFDIERFIQPQASEEQNTHGSDVESDSETLSTGSNENLPSNDKKLRLAFNHISRDKTLLYKGPKVSVTTTGKDFILHKIREVFWKLNQDVYNGRRLMLKVRDLTSWKNILFENDRLVLKPIGEASVITIRRSSKTSENKFKLIIYLMKKMLNLITLNAHCTKREIYYQIVNFVKQQCRVNTALNTISCMLDVPPWELGIISTSKGLVYGDIRIIISDQEIIHCNIKGGTLIPQDVRKIKRIDSNAYFILIVEKDSIFQKLLDEDIPNKLSRPFLLITGKGYADMNTMLFINKLWMQLSIPVFILVDADPHGIEIMLSYRFGSLSTSFLSKYIALPAIRWIGVHPTEIEMLQIEHQPLTVRDISKIGGLLKRPYMKFYPAIENELKFMLKSNCKAEIEGLVKCHQFLSNFYLPNKFYTKGFI